MTSNLGNSELVNILIERIQQAPEQAICFRDFMELCLYHETHGYYMQEKLKIGKQGDFFTSSSLGKWMGTILARYISRQVMLHYPKATKIHLIEWGGGNGKLCRQILDELMYKDTELYHRLYIHMIETSAYHQQLQKAELFEHHEKIKWSVSQEEIEVQTDNPQFIIANELLDAFAVHKVRKSLSGYEESYVTWDNDNRTFLELWQQLHQPQIQSYIERLSVSVRIGQILEVNLVADQWIEKISNQLKVGHVIVFDYGELVERIWIPEKTQGTLRAYFQHRLYHDLLSRCGEQDLTSDVNFSAIIATAKTQGFTAITFQTQAQFLVEHGILDYLHDHQNQDPFSVEAKNNRAIRQLIIGDELSSRFKVLILQK